MFQSKGAQYRTDKSPLHEMGMIQDETNQRWLEERARGEKFNKRQDYDEFRANESRPRTPNKEHLHEMGLLYEPYADDWYKEKNRVEKIQKRREYDKYLVSIARLSYKSVSCYTSYKLHVYFHLCSFLQRRLKADEMFPRKVEPREESTFPGRTDSERRDMEWREKREKNREYREYMEQADDRQKKELPEMGMLMNLDHQDWFEEQKRLEKEKKRRDYDKYMVGEYTVLYMLINGLVTSLC